MLTVQQVQAFVYPSLPVKNVKEVIAPAATPRDIISKLNGDIVAILKQPELHARLAADGAEPWGSTSDEFGRHLKSEIAKWAKVVATAKLRPE